MLGRVNLIHSGSLVSSLQYHGHADVLAPAVAELYELENRAQVLLRGMSVMVSLASPYALPRCAHVSGRRAHD